MTLRFVFMSSFSFPAPSCVFLRVCLCALGNTSDTKSPALSLLISFGRGDYYHPISLLENGFFSVFSCYDRMHFIFGNLANASRLRDS